MPPLPIYPSPPLAHNQHHRGARHDKHTHHNTPLYSISRLPRLRLRLRLPHRVRHPHSLCALGLQLLERLVPVILHDPPLLEVLDLSSPPTPQCTHQPPATSSHLLTSGREKTYPAAHTLLLKRGRRRRTLLARGSAVLDGVDDVVAVQALEEAVARLPAFCALAAVWGDALDGGGVYAAAAAAAAAVAAEPAHCCGCRWLWGANWKFFGGGGGGFGRESNDVGGCLDGC